MKTKELKKVKKNVFSPMVFIPDKKKKKKSIVHPRAHTHVHKSTYTRTQKEGIIENFRQKMRKRIRREPINNFNVTFSKRKIVN